MAKRPKFQRPTGMHDILPEDQKYFKRIYTVVSEIADFYGFGKIDTPILEETELFSKGIGLATDIVKKEMYSLKTKGGDLLSLRPEWTAPIVRSYIENGMKSLPQPLKLWYFGPCYRYERPQADRYRQFWQFGFEIFGEQSPVVDAQIIQIFYNILKELKLKNLIVEINSIGDSNCRPYYKKLLSNYFKSRDSSLCGNCKKRLKENVLRVLDCKEEKCQPIKAEAPQILDHLCDQCHTHFKEVLEFLDEIEIPYNLNPNLVRGLDYYTKTVFEIFSETEPGPDQEVIRNALAGGGRYDKLIKLLRGKDTPASGAAAGVERIVNLMKVQEVKITKSVEAEIFLAQLGNLAKRKSLKLLESFRKAKIKIEESFGRDSLKAQLNRADKIGAKYTLILGQKEALDGVIIIRDMKTGNQEIVKMDKVVERVKKKLK
jgi:histidyl-tRNA synthetase